MAGLEGEVGATVRVAQRRDGGNDHQLAAVPGQDVVVLQIDGGQQLVLHPENARDLLRAQSGQKRGRSEGAGGEAGLTVPTELGWSGLEQAASSARGSSRGFLGKVVLKLFQIVRPKAATLAGEKLVQKIDGQVTEGVYRLGSEVLAALDGAKRMKQIAVTKDHGRALVHNYASAMARPRPSVKARSSHWSTAWLRFPSSKRSVRRGASTWMAYVRATRRSTVCSISADGKSSRASCATPCRATRRRWRPNGSGNCC